MAKKKSLTDALDTTTPDVQETVATTETQEQSTENTIVNQNVLDLQVPADEVPEQVVQAQQTVATTVASVTEEVVPVQEFVVDAPVVSPNNITIPAKNEFEVGDRVIVNHMPGTVIAKRSIWVYDVEDIYDYTHRAVPEYEVKDGTVNQQVIIQNANESFS